MEPVAFFALCRKRSLNVRVADGCTESHRFRGIASVEAWLTSPPARPLNSTDPKFHVPVRISTTREEQTM